MSAKSRTKGHDGERELRRLLADELGDQVRRNLGQTRDGGHDLEGVGPFALEVKRHKAATDSLVRAWWQQAEQQASTVHAIPALAYRGDRQPWRVLVPLAALDLRFAQWSGPDWTASLSVPAFSALVRELLHRTAGKAP